MKRWISQIRQSEFFAIVASVVGIIIGALLTAYINKLLFNKFFSSFEEIILLLLLVVILFLFLLFLFIIAFIRISEKRDDYLIKQLGIPAELMFEPIDRSSGNYYRKLTSFVQQTSGKDEDEILCLDYITNKKSFEDKKETKDHMEAIMNYSENLLKKATEDGIIYHRIICFEEGKNVKIKDGNLRQWKLEHCEKMLQIQKEKPDKIFLKKSAANICASFVIIGKKKAIIGVDVHNEGGTVHTDGGLIFYNPPNEKIIEHLTKLFREAENKSVSVEKIPEE